MALVLKKIFLLRIAREGEEGLVWFGGKLKNAEHAAGRGVLETWSMSAWLKYQMIILGKDKPVTETGNSDAFCLPDQSFFRPTKTIHPPYKACDWSTRPAREQGRLQLVESIKPRLN